MKIDDSSIVIPPYDGPDKSELKDKKLTAEQIEVVLAKIFSDETDVEESNGRE